MPKTQIRVLEQVFWAVFLGALFGPLSPEVHPVTGIWMHLGFVGAQPSQVVVHDARSFA